MAVIGGTGLCRELSQTGRFQTGEFPLDPVRREAQRRALSPPLSKTKIVSGALGTKAVAIGAAVYALGHTPIYAIFAT